MSRNVIHRSKLEVTCSGFAPLAQPVVLSIAVLMILSPTARAQEGQSSGAAQEPPGVWESIGRWFDEQAATINSTFNNTQKKIESFGEDAGAVAESTMQGAKNAADTVARLPNARVISGHEKCQLAANGAPDCTAAADALCQAQGFKSGKGLDMTRAETCPTRIYLSGRSSGPECKTETFVSRAVCQ